MNVKNYLPGNFPDLPISPLIKGGNTGSLNT